MLKNNWSLNRFNWKLCYRQYWATHMRPSNARRVFPCFDEPGYKAKFYVSISRPKTHATLFNTQVQSTTDM